MFGNGGRALTIAAAAQALAERTERFLKDHVDACGKAAEMLRRELAEREDRSLEWRINLGKRLDIQDELIKAQGSFLQRAQWAIIVLLITVIGFLAQYAIPWGHLAK